MVALYVSLRGRSLLATTFACCTMLFGSSSVSAILSVICKQETVEFHTTNYSHGIIKPHVGVDLADIKLPKALGGVYRRQGDRCAKRRNADCVESCRRSVAPVAEGLHSEVSYRDLISLPVGDRETAR